MTNKTSLLGSWVRRFLMEHLISERNLANNTRQSYRDTLCLFLPFIAEQTRKSIDKLEVDDISNEKIQRFLKDLEQKRGCSIATRN